MVQDGLGTDLGSYEPDPAELLVAVNPFLAAGVKKLSQTGYTMAPSGPIKRCVDVAQSTESPDERIVEGSFD